MDELSIAVTCLCDHAYLLLIWFLGLIQMASLAEAVSAPQQSPAMSEDDVHNYGISIELIRHARTLPKDHPDRSKFMLESARLRVGTKPDADDSALKNLTEPYNYDIPHDLIRQRRQAHLDNRARFEREVLNVERPE